MLTLLAVKSVEAGRTAALVPVHVWMAVTAMEADRWLDRARVKTVVYVIAVHSLVDQFQLVSVNRHLQTAALRLVRRLNHDSTQTGDYDWTTIKLRFNRHSTSLPLQFDRATTIRRP